MPRGFTSPSILFVNSWNTAERSYGQALLSELTKRYSRYVEPCVGAFAQTMTSVAAGWAPSHMETSDVSLYSAVCGYLYSGRDLRSLDVRVDGEVLPLPDEPLDAAAEILWAQLRCRMLARTDGEKSAKPYYDELLLDIERRRRGHVGEIRRRLASQREKLRGLSYESMGIWEHLDLVADDPATIVVTNPPSYRCLSVHERILTADLRWVEAGRIREGDRLLAFDEHSPDGPTRRHWRFATVTHSERGEAQCVRVVLASGKSVVCTVDHPWLVATGEGAPRRWLRADQLLVRSKAGPQAQHRYALKALEPWNEQRSYEAGWLAGMFDGEGSLHIGYANKLSITQAEGPVADLVRGRLRACGFKPAVISSRPRGPLSHKPMLNLYVRGGFPELANALGSLRPTRLLDVFQRAQLGDRRISTWRDEIVAVEPVGVQPIQSIETSTRTYVGEGYLMHNSGYEKFFDTRGRLAWAEPTYDIWTPETDFPRLVERMDGTPALLLFIMQTPSDQPNAPVPHPHPIYARDMGGGRYNYWISNRPDEVFGIMGRRVRTRRLAGVTPLRAPILPPDHPITPESVVRFERIGAGTASYYKQLWIHRIRQGQAPTNMALLIDGHVAGVFGYSLEPIVRNYHPGGKWSDAVLLVYGAAPAHVRHGARIGRLVTQLALQRTTLRQAIGDFYTASANVIVTSQWTPYPESKTLRGLMKLHDRKPDPQAGYRLLYQAPIGELSPQEVLRAWLTSEERYWRQRQSTSATG